jgi:uncharacterized integral membrane protein (TIGR00697 family)
MKIQKMDLLVSLYTFCIVVAELMGGKTIPLFKIADFQLNASVAIFVFPLIFTINDIITEVYGRERTRSLIRSNLVIIFLLIIVSLGFTALPPSARFVGTESAYDQIFHISARISAASLVAFIVAEFSDVIIFSKIREKLGKNSLWLRTNLSNFSAMFLDTVLFMTLAFYNLSLPLTDNWNFLISLIVPYWLLKCFASVVETPIAYWGVAWLKKDEKKK